MPQTVLQGLPLAPSHLSEPELLGLIVATVKPPWGDLDSSVVTLREGGRVLIQDSDAISPVLQVEMIPDLVTSSRGLWAAGKGAPVTVFKTILPHVVGWDIMGYESEPPPS